MRLCIVFFLVIITRQISYADEWWGLSRYYPEGTSWTEIVLDTLLHDDWFSIEGDKWIANFDTITYYVHSDTVMYNLPYNKIYLHRTGVPDSLVFYAVDAIVSGMGENYDMELLEIGTFRYGLSYFSGPKRYMQFDWKPGSSFRGTQSFVDSESVKYSVPDKIMTGYFGGEQPLNYVDVIADVRWGSTRYSCPVRILQGIGVTSWNGYEAIFGPMNARYATTRYVIDRPIYPYRSMLVHFERGGEVLYDVWPQPEETGVESPIPISPRISDDALYDLQGRRLNAAPHRGLYIQGGKMRMAW